MIYHMKNLDLTHPCEPPVPQPNLIDVIPDTNTPNLPNMNK